MPLVPGASAPKLVSRPMLGRMRRGAVMVDISIDQGGNFEASRPTTHADPMTTGIVGIALATGAGHAASIPLDHRYAGAPARRFRLPASMSGDGAVGLVAGPAGREGGA